MSRQESSNLLSPNMAVRGGLSLNPQHLNVRGVNYAFTPGQPSLVSSVSTPHVHPHNAANPYAVVGSRSVGSGLQPTPYASLSKSPIPQQQVQSKRDILMYDVAALMDAVRWGDKELTVEMLETSNFSRLIVDATNNPELETPLHVAASFGRREITKVLLGYGANISKRNHKGKTPLHLAAKEGHWIVVKCLIERGADVDIIDKDHNTPLHTATIHPQVSEILLKNGATINILNKKDQTPIHTACIRGEKSVTEMLLKAVEEEIIKRSNPEYERKQLGPRVRTTPLQDIVNAADSLGNTPLHHAAFWGNDDVVDVLINYRARVNVSNNEGKTPLELGKKREPSRRLFQVLERELRNEIRMKALESPSLEVYRNTALPRRMQKMFKETTSLNELEDLLDVTHTMVRDKNKRPTRLQSSESTDGSGKKEFVRRNTIDGEDEKHKQIRHLNKEKGLQHSPSSPSGEKYGNLVDDSPLKSMTTAKSLEGSSSDEVQFSSIQVETASQPTISESSDHPTAPARTRAGSRPRSSTYSDPALVVALNQQRRYIAQDRRTSSFNILKVKSTDDSMEVTDDDRSVFTDDSYLDDTMSETSQVSYPEDVTAYGAPFANERKSSRLKEKILKRLKKKEKKEKSPNGKTKTIQK